MNLPVPIPSFSLHIQGLHWQVFRDGILMSEGEVPIDINWLDHHCRTYLEVGRYFTPLPSDEAINEAYRQDTLRWQRQLKEKKLGAKPQQGRKKSAGMEITLADLGL